MRISAFLPFIVLLPCVSGCVAVAAGAAAGGATGYYISKEEDRSSAQMDEDTAITARVKGRFAQDPQLATLTITIDSYDAIVTLAGDVPDETLAERAIATARRTAQVKGVRSELIIH